MISFNRLEDEFRRILVEQEILKIEPSAYEMDGERELWRIEMEEEGTDDSGDEAM